MTCPYCGSSTNVTNSRSRAKGSQVWRRRTCKQCQAVWSTREEIDLSTSHYVGSETSRKPFSRDKLFISIKESLNHRKTALDDATALTDTIIAQLLTLKTPLLPKALLKSTTQTCLSRFDKTGAAVYDAVHRL